MEPRKLSGTEKISVTMPEKLYNSIVDYIKLQHEYANVPEFISSALKYFKMRYVYDIDPIISKEIAEKAKLGVSIESVEFISEFDGKSTSKQATVATGVMINIHGLITHYPYLNFQNVKEYSVEYFYNAIVKSRDIYATKYGKIQGFTDKDFPEDYSAPNVKYKCTYRKEELN